jgi:phage terminase large subunit
MFIAQTLCICLLIMEAFSGIRIGDKWQYQPQAKQKTFHDAILNRPTNGYRDFLYGGAAKGGKSHSLRWEAHRNCLQYPNLRGLLIRSSFPELERTHLSLINFDLPQQAMRYNGQYHKATYFNGSTLEFGYGDRREDFKQYLSAEYDFIMIDELTTIPFEFSFLLRSRLAASRSDFIPFWACATNPGDIAHVDVRSYFVKKDMHDAERFPAYSPSEVCFIPATVFDNKILIDRDPGIVQRLRQLSKKDQQKFLYGNWDIFEGQFFDEFFSDIHVVRPADYLTYEQLLMFQNVAGMDYGNYSAAEFQMKDYNGNVVVYDEWTDIKSVRSKKIETLKKFMGDRGLSSITIEADTNMWVPDAFDKADRTDPASDFEAGGVMLQRVSKNVGRAEMNRGYRVVCNDAVRNYLHWEENETGELIVKPRLLIYERCVKLIETLPLLMVDDKDQEDIADQGDLDTWYDAFKMGFMTLWQPIAPKKQRDAYKTQAEFVKEEIMEPIVRRTLAPRVNSETI